MSPTTHFTELGLVNTREMFQKAMAGQYAVPAYNFNNMEQLQGIILGCVESRSPVILQVSGSARKYANQTFLKYMAIGAVQMARELGMNPKKLGQKANHRQEPWKVPLPEFIEQLYLKRFGKARPDHVRSIEQIVQDKKRKQAERKVRKLETSEDRQPPTAV